MSFDFDLFVIGAGSGDVRTAYSTASFGARVAAAGSRYPGGICVNVGCVPKKLLVYDAHFNEDLGQARAYGWSTGETQFDWVTLIGNKNCEIQRLNRTYHNSLVNSGVTLFEGHARLLDAHNVEVGGQCFSAKRTLVATGGWLQVSDVPDKEHVITSSEVFFLERLPCCMLVVDGNYIAVRSAPVSNGLSAKTTLPYRRDLFLHGFDRNVREHLRDKLGKKSLDLQFNSDIARIDKQADGNLAVTLKDGRVLETSCMFYTTGQQPMLDDLGLGNTGAKLAGKGFIIVDGHYQTNEPSILILGGVIGHAQLTLVALTKDTVVVRRLLKPEEYHPVDYELIPTAMFDLFNIGTVNLAEEEALGAGHEMKVFEDRFRLMKLIPIDDREKTLTKLVVDTHDGRVPGCHTTGAEAGEILQGIAVAMKAGVIKQALDETIGIRLIAAKEFVT